MALFTKSIRWRFVAWLAFLLACVLSGFGVTAYQLHRVSRFEQLDQELKQRVAVLSTALRTPPMPDNRGGMPPERSRDFGPPPGDGFGGPRRGDPPPPDRFGGPGSRRDPGGPEFRETSEIASLFSPVTGRDYYYEVWSRSGGGLLSSSTNTPAGGTQPAQPGKDTGTFFRNRGEFREAFHYTERGDCVLTGCSITPEQAAMRRFAFWLVAGALSVLLLGIGGVWILAGRALKPVEEISAAATRIAAGNLAERINVASTDNELGQLAGTLNSTFARLDAAFTQQKQFTADAAHELRTPLAVLISEAQTTLARERSPAEYRETIVANLDTAQQMRRLTDALLQLARFDSGQENVRRERVDLADVVRDCVKLLHPLADARGLRLITELSPAPTRGDAEFLNRVVTNLVSNAIQYNQASGEIRIVTSSDGGTTTLVVADTGCGIEAEDLAQIFKRFYRADKSRTRTNGNSGLGLAICKAITDAHGGSIEVTSAVGNGTTFTVRLPA